MPSNCRTMLAMLASQCARLQLAAFLLLLSCSACSYAQPLAPQLALASAASKPNITVHNYTLDGQVLYTVCPCKPTWQLKAHNGTLLHLSGCANPNNDPAVSLWMLKDMSCSTVGSDMLINYYWFTSCPPDAITAMTVGLVSAATHRRDLV